MFNYVKENIEKRILKKKKKKKKVVEGKKVVGEGWYILVYGGAYLLFINYLRSLILLKFFK